MSDNKYPDLHISTGLSPYIRKRNGELEKITKIPTSSGEYEEVGIFERVDLIEIIKFLIGDKGFDRLMELKEVDASYNYENIDRFRINCYFDQNGFSVAMRLIPSDIPELKDICLGEEMLFKEMIQKNKGLILITGPTGSGKSTTLASIIEYLAKTNKKHIITIEDPIEFSFNSHDSLINQRELGTHTNDFSKAIKAALREDPDVIMVGEMRDTETMEAALTLAETGHLVFSTLHTNDSVQTISRIIDAFPEGEKEQIQIQLGLNLISVVSQRLIPRQDKDGRIAAREILINNDAIRNMILKNNLQQIYGILETNKTNGMILMDTYMVKLYKRGIISKRELLRNIRDRENVEKTFEINFSKFDD